MSNNAINWAFTVPVAKSADRLLLVCLANHENKGQSWPSQKHLVDQTSLDPKTVWAGLSRLSEAGYIVDTGERKGTTKQVVVWRLTVGEAPPKTESLKERRIPKTESVRKNGRLPDSPGKDSVFPEEGFRISEERIPKTEYGTLTEPTKEPIGEPPNARERPAPPPLELVSPDKPTKPTKPERPVVPVPKPVKGDDAELLAFWAAYPRKREGIGAARKPFAAARKRASFEEIIIGVERYPFDERDDGRFLPHAATWLNQDRWTTQPDTKPIRAGPAPRTNTDIARRLMALDMEDDEPPPLDTSDTIDLDPGDFHET